MYGDASLEPFYNSLDACGPTGMKSRFAECLPIVIGTNGQLIQEYKAATKLGNISGVYLSTQCPIFENSIRRLRFMVV